MPKLSDSILHKIRCTNCKSWVSCGPVRVLEDGGSVCGRCRIRAPVDQFRHIAYEALACYFQFPCKYWERHCREAVSFKEVIPHENECSFSPGCCFCCCHPFTACSSDRKLNINAAIQLEMVPEQILEYLRCSMCAGYISSTPVLVAKDGTSICHRCSIQENLIKNPEYRRHMIFEAFANMMIFPCVFRYEGCTGVFKFGEAMHVHEIDCLYNTNRNEPRKSQHRIYGSTTPTAALFALTTEKALEKVMFPADFKNHKEILATKWSQHQEKIAQREAEAEAKAEAEAEAEAQERSFADRQRWANMSFSQTDAITRPPPARTDSITGSGFHNTLISELKIKQSFRQHRLENSDGNVSVEASTSSGYSDQGNSPNFIQGKINY